MNETNSLEGNSNEISAFPFVNQSDPEDVSGFQFISDEIGSSGTSNASCSFPTGEEFDVRYIYILISSDLNFSQVNAHNFDFTSSSGESSHQNKNVTGSEFQDGTVPVLKVSSGKSVSM